MYIVMMKKRASSNIINPMVPWSGALLLGQGFNAYIWLGTIILTDYCFVLNKVNSVMSLYVMLQF